MQLHDLGEAPQACPAVGAGDLEDSKWCLRVVSGARTAQRPGAFRMHGLVIVILSPVGILALLPASCVTFGGFLNLSVMFLQQ